MIMLPDYRMIRTLTSLLIAMGAVLLTAVPASAVITPNLGVATIDGDASEWTPADVVAPLYRAGRDDKPIEGYLSLRYDPFGSALYALLMSANGANVITTPGDAFIKLGNSTKLVDGDTGVNGVLPEFAWVGLPNAVGFEAAVSLAPGSYADLNVHLQVYSDGESQTAALAGRRLAISLPEPGDDDDLTFEIEPTNDTSPAVPEPASVMLLGAGMAALALRRGRTVG